VLIRFDSLFSAFALLTGRDGSANLELYRSLGNARPPVGKADVDDRIELVATGRYCLEQPCAGQSERRACSLEYAFAVPGDKAIVSSDDPSDRCAGTFWQGVSAAEHCERAGGPAATDCLHRLDLD